MAQITFSDDQKAGYDALAAAVAVCPAGTGLSRADDLMRTAAFGDYTPTTPEAIVVLFTTDTGASAVTQVDADANDYAVINTATGVTTSYADLSALQTAVAGM